MKVHKGHAAAWTAHDITLQALVKFSAQCDLANGSKLSREDAQTIVQLSSEVEHWQERIRIHRGKLIPGVAPRVKPKASKGNRDIRIGSGLPAMPTPPAERPTLSDSEGEQGEHLGQSHEADGEG